MTDHPLRVMWLLNHTTAREFEVPMLKRLGVTEIFLPKRIPADPSFRSASVDFSEDKYLTIPPEELAVLNATDWYNEPSPAAWQIANRYFDIAFFILLSARFLGGITRNFSGAKIWRTYGLGGLTYGEMLRWLSQRKGMPWPHDDRNIWFGQAYEHLSKAEPEVLRNKSVFLPAGMRDTEISEGWTGEDKRILFVCPDLAFNDYYSRVYDKFKETFVGLPYVVGGSQPVQVDDPHVIGFVPRDEHERNMRRLRVMYYHSAEPNHIHYHPFEAVKAGMPLVFMGGGILDRFGGLNLPGRCTSFEEARSKVERILGGDLALCAAIRKSQSRLLEPLTEKYAEPHWRAGLSLVREKLNDTRALVGTQDRRKRRIAVILPVPYRGGTLRAAKLVASAIESGARSAGRDDVEIVFGYPSSLDASPGNSDGLPKSIKRRPFQWRILSLEEAERTAAYAGLQGVIFPQSYQAPDDGINQFLDCDLWVIVSDRLNLPLLPLRPHLLVVYDYLQRYEPVMDDQTLRNLVQRAHAAEAVVVTTKFTARDARQFAGLPAKSIRLAPMLAPEFANTGLPSNPKGTSSYFIWTTNLGIHKNHLNAVEALRLYYEQYRGSLRCKLTGVETGKILEERSSRHLRDFGDVLKASTLLRKRLKIEGELPDAAYRDVLRGAAFLWHPAKVDNGSLSVVEAAHYGVPSLSSDYPAMREIDEQFELHLAWMDPDDPQDMALRLWEMEKELENPQRRRPSKDRLAKQSLVHLAPAYWAIVEDYL